MEKWLFLGLGKGMDQMSLAQLVVPETEEMLKTQKTGTGPRCVRAKRKELTMAKSGKI